MCQLHSFFIALGAANKCVCDDVRWSRKRQMQLKRHPKQSYFAFRSFTAPTSFYQERLVGHSNQRGTRNFHHAEEIIAFHVCLLWTNLKIECSSHHCCVLIGGLVVAS